MSKHALVLGLGFGALAFAGGVLLGGGVFAQQKFPATKTILTQDLVGIDGYEAQIIEIDVAPGAGIGGHRHSGHMFVYVIEGEIVSQLEDGEKIAYKPGEFWYEHPLMLHADFQNPSATVPAKAVIFSVVEKGKPQTLLEPQAH